MNRNCALCQKEAELRNSHLIPQSIYRLLKDDDTPGGENLTNDLVLVTQSKTFTSSEESRQLLLCEDCEMKFKTREDYFLFIADTITSKGPKQSQIQPNIISFNRWALSHSDLGLNHENISYFARSIFWRASVKLWKFNHRRIKIELGCYQEDLRRSLLSDRQLKNTRLLIAIPKQPRTERSFTFPTSKKLGMIHYHSFTILGIRFVLVVGGMLPALSHEQCFVLSPEKPIHLLEYEEFIRPELGLLTTSKPTNQFQRRYSQI